MSPQETLQILQNLISMLNIQRQSHVANGQLEAVVRADVEIASTQATIDILASTLQGE